MKKSLPLFGILMLMLAGAGCQSKPSAEQQLFYNTSGRYLAIPSGGMIQDEAQVLSNQYEAVTRFDTAVVYSPDALRLKINRAGRSSEYFQQIRGDVILMLESFRIAKV